MERKLDEMALERGRVQCIVGVYPGEREQPQPLEVGLTLFFDTRRVQREGLKASVDYARLWGELKFLLESCHFRTLETAAEALARYALAPPTEDGHRAQVEAVTVMLTKPQALGGEVVPTLRVHRRANEYTIERETKAFGAVDVIHESKTHGIYRLRIKPGGTIQAHVHQVMKEHELVLGTGLLLQGKPVTRGMAYRWPKDFAHRYDNPTTSEQTILCVDSPAFIPADEVEVAMNGPLELPKGQRYYPPGDAEVTL